MYCIFVNCRFHAEEMLAFRKHLNRHLRKGQELVPLHLVMERLRGNPRLLDQQVCLQHNRVYAQQAGPGRKHGARSCAHCMFTLREVLAVFDAHSAPEPLTWDRVCVILRNTVPTPRDMEGGGRSSITSGSTEGGAEASAGQRLPQGSSSASDPAHRVEGGSQGGNQTTVVCHAEKLMWRLADFAPLLNGDADIPLDDYSVEELQRYTVQFGPARATVGYKVRDAMVVLMGFVLNAEATGRFHMLGSEGRPPLADEDDALASDSSASLPSPNLDGELRLAPEGMYLAPDVGADVRAVRVDVDELALGPVTPVESDILRHVERRVHALCRASPDFPNYSGQQANFCGWHVVCNLAAVPLLPVAPWLGAWQSLRGVLHGALPSGMQQEFHANMSDAAIGSLLSDVDLLVPHMYLRGKGYELYEVSCSNRMAVPVTQAGLRSLLRLGCLGGLITGERRRPDGEISRHFAAMSLRVGEFGEIHALAGGTVDEEDPISLLFVDSCLQFPRRIADLGQLQAICTPGTAWPADEVHTSPWRTTQAYFVVPADVGDQAPTLCALTGVRGDSGMLDHLGEGGGSSSALEVLLSPGPEAIVREASARWRTELQPTAWPEPRASAPQGRPPGSPVASAESAATGGAVADSLVIHVDGSAQGPPADEARSPARRPWLGAGITVAAAAVPDQELEARAARLICPGGGSNAEAELFAVAVALMYLLELQQQRGAGCVASALVYTDCRFVWGIMEAGYTLRHRLEFLQAAILQLKGLVAAGGTTVRFAHVGRQGNTRADALACWGAQAGESRSASDPPVAPPVDTVQVWRVDEGRLVAPASTREAPLLPCVLDEVTAVSVPPPLSEREEHRVLRAHKLSLCLSLALSGSKLKDADILRRLLDLAGRGGVDRLITELRTLRHRQQDLQAARDAAPSGPGGPREVRVQEERRARKAGKLVRDGQIRKGWHALVRTGGLPRMTADRLAQVQEHFPVADAERPAPRALLSSADVMATDPFPRVTLEEVAAGVRGSHRHAAPGADGFRGGWFKYLLPPSADTRRQRRRAGGQGEFVWRPFVDRVAGAGSQPAAESGALSSSGTARMGLGTGRGREDDHRSRNDTRGRRGPSRRRRRSLAAIGRDLACLEDIRRWGLRGLHMLVLRILRADLPAPVLASVASAQLIAISKGDGQGVRPISMVGVLRKLVARLVVGRFRRRWTEFLSPVQRGVGVANGTLIITRLLQQCWEDGEAQHDILGVDLARAFNTVRREVVHREVLAICPELRGVVAALYPASIRQFVRMGDGSVVVVPSTDGCLQGCPLGSSFFCIAVHHVLTDCLLAFTSSAGQCPVTLNAYVDDLVLSGPRRELCRFLPVLQRALCERVGVAVNPDKCVVLSRDSSAAQEWQEFRGINLSASDVSNHGLVFLGVPIGLSEYRTTWLARRLPEVREEWVMVFSTSGLDPRVGFTLLRSCALPQLTFLLRALTPALFPNGSLASLDCLVWDCLARLLSDDWLDYTRDLDSGLVALARAHAALPQSMGGLGLRSFATLGWAASAAGYVDVLQEAAPASALGSSGVAVLDGSPASAVVPPDVTVGVHLEPVDGVASPAVVGGASLGALVAVDAGDPSSLLLDSVWTLRLVGGAGASFHSWASVSPSLTAFGGVEVLAVTTVSSACLSITLRADCAASAFSVIPVVVQRLVALSPMERLLLVSPSFRITQALRLHAAGPGLRPLSGRADCSAVGMVSWRTQLLPLSLWSSWCLLPQLQRLASAVSRSVAVPFADSVEAARAFLRGEPAPGWRVPEDLRAVAGAMADVLYPPLVAAHGGEVPAAVQARVGDDGSLLSSAARRRAVVYAALAPGPRRQRRATAWLEGSSLSQYLQGTLAPFQVSVDASGVAVPSPAQVARARARLHAQQGLGANAFLRSRVLPPALRFLPTAVDWRLSVAAMLGLPTLPAGFRRHCVCGDALLADGGHLAHCRSGGGRIHRHDRVGEAFVATLRFLSPSVRFSSAPPCTRRDPPCYADVAFTGLSPSGFVVDFVITHALPGSAADVRRFLGAPSTARQSKAEGLKIRKHVPSGRAGCTTFRPVALNSYGVPGPRTVTFLRELAAPIALHSGRTERAIVGHLLYVLSVATTTFTARTIWKRRHALAFGLAGSRAPVPVPSAGGVSSGASSASFPLSLGARGAASSSLRV